MQKGKNKTAKIKSGIIRFYYFLTYPLSQLLSLWQNRDNRKRIIWFIFVITILPIVSWYFLSLAIPSFNCGSPDTNLFFGYWISISSLILTFIVLLKFIPRNVSDTGALLDIFSEVLRKSSKDHKLIFIAPTFFIGRMNYEMQFKSFRKLLLKRLNQGVKVQFAFYQSTIHSSFPIQLDDSQKNNLIKSNTTTDLLVKFHTLFLPTSDNVDDISERNTYYMELYGMMNQLIGINGFTYIPLNATYDTTDFVALINENTNDYFLGRYEITTSLTGAKGFSFSGSLFESSTKIEQINKMVNEFIIQNKA